MFKQAVTISFLFFEISVCAPHGWCFEKKSLDQCTKLVHKLPENEKVKCVIIIQNMYLVLNFLLISDRIKSRLHILIEDIHNHKYASLIV